MNKSPNLLYQHYRLISLAVYAAVLGAGLLDWMHNGIGPRAIVEAPENMRFLVFVMTMLTLIGLELRAVGQASFETFKEVKLIPFLIRLSLFSMACLVTDLNYSELLFLPILLYSYLAVSKRLSYFLAILSIVVLFNFWEANNSLIRPSQIPLSNGQLVTDELLGGGLIDGSIGSLIMLLFTLLLARAILQATHNQQELTELLASLETSHIRLKQYASRVADLSATEERNCLAHYIHDSLGHHLAAINIQLEKANAYKECDSNRAHEAIVVSQRTVQDALKDVRQSVGSLRQNGSTFLFQPALNDLIRRMYHSDLELTLHQTGDSSRYSRLKLIILYHVIQEGLTNVHKHANASQASISIEFGVHSASLDLSDNGAGFDITALESVENELQKHGLNGLKERLSLVGGSLILKSRPQKTTLIVSIPQASSIASVLETLNTAHHLNNR